MLRYAIACVLCLTPSTHVISDDWPQWFGPQRDGVWREAGVVDSLPKEGPKLKWRIPIHAGYCGPAVANGRVFLLDRQAAKLTNDSGGAKGKAGLPGDERVLCVSSSDGKVLWQKSYDCPYRVSYPEGPRATPTVDGDKVYVLGAMGRLACHAVSDGAEVWSVQLAKTFNAPVPAWGWSSPPLVVDDLLVGLVGGKDSALVAFDKSTGKERWRSLQSEEVGYAPPALATIHGKRQVVVYFSDLVAGVDPKTGAKLWSTPYPVKGKPSRPATPIGIPRVVGDKILVTSFYEGSMLIEVAADMTPKVLWHGYNINSFPISSGLHGLMTTPVVDGDYFYGVCAFGELRCLEMMTGKRVWETYAAVGGKKAMFGTAFLVPHGKHYFLFNDNGDLILADLSPKGFKELGRSHLIDATQNARGGRKVVWAHPAYAERSIFVRNHEHLACYSLEAAP